MPSSYPTDGPTDAQRLASALAHLGRCQEPSELIYSREAQLPSVEPPAGTSEDYSVTVARRIATVLGRLAELSRPERQRVQTPRALLLELMDIIQHGLFLSLPTDMRHLGPGGGQPVTAAFHSYVSSRRIPVESMMEGLHCLTYVSMKLRVELVTAQLRRRIAAELEALTDVAASSVAAVAVTEEEIAALLVTDTLLDDFTDTYNNALLTVPVMAAAAVAALGPAAATSRMSPGASSLALGDTAALDALLPTLHRYYYQLCDWTLVTSSATTVSPVALTRVTRADLDEKKGTLEVELLRPDGATPWGLLLNEAGRLIGIDTSMRVGDTARELQALLRCSQEGAAVIAVNEKPVPRPGARGDEGADPSMNRAVLESIQAASANHSRKRLRLTVASGNFKGAILHAPAELVFSCRPQGGEGASGQRAALLFHRLSARTPWQFAIDAELMWFAPPPRLLSEGVRGFVRSYPYRLRVFAVNGVEVASAVQVRDIVDRVEVLLIELVVVPVAEAAAASRKVTRGGATTDTTTAVETEHVAQHHVPPPVQSAAAIERQVREATQRLMLTHAQREDAADAPVIELPAAVEAELEGGAAVDPAADRILREMLRDGGVDTGDTAAAAVAAAVTRKKVRAPRAKKAEAVTDTNPSTSTIDDSSAKAASAAVPLAAPTPAVAPCLFQNNVKLLAFEESTMSFTRPSVEKPWGLKITHMTDAAPLDATGTVFPLRVLALPQPLPAAVTHPFLKQFSTGKALWLIESINGKSAAGDPKKMLELMRRATKMSIKLLRP